MKYDKYYLDTVAIRKLASQLTNRLYPDLIVSLLTIKELIANIQDESSFLRQHSIISNLLRSNIQIDPTPSELLMLKAYMIDENPYKELPEKILRIATFACFAPSYDAWMKCIDINGFNEILNYINITDNLGSLFNQSLSKHHANNPKQAIKEYEDRWNGGISKEEMLKRVVEYYFNIYSERYPEYKPSMRYDGSIDLFMLAHARYVDQKVASHNPAGRNDFLDLQHLLYIREDAKLVTDDVHMTDYVNSVDPGRAISTLDFLKEYSMS